MSNTQLIGPSWELAACAGKDTEMFFPEGPRDIAKKIADAKAVCGGCPITAQCFAWAVENNEQGIWGGTTETERKSLMRSGGGSLRGVRRISEKSFDIVTKAPAPAYRIANAQKATTVRSRAATAKSVALISKALDKLGGNVPESLLRPATLRVNNPDASFAEIAEMAGVTRDSLHGSLRRLVELSRK